MRRFAPMLALVLLALSTPPAEAQNCGGMSVGMNGGVIGALSEDDCRTVRGERFENTSLILTRDSPRNFQITLASSAALRFTVVGPDGAPVTMWGEERIRFGNEAGDMEGYAKVSLIGVDPGRYTIQVASAGALGRYMLSVTDPGVSVRGTCAAIYSDEVPLNTRRSVTIGTEISRTACKLPYGRLALTRRFTLHERSDVTIRAEAGGAHISVLEGDMVADSVSAHRTASVAEIRETLDPGSYVVALGREGTGKLAYEVIARPATRSSAQRARERADCLTERAVKLNLSGRSYLSPRHDYCGAVENGARAVYTSVRVPASGHLTVDASLWQSPPQALTLRLFSEDGELVTSLASTDSSSLALRRYRVTPGVYFIVLHGALPQDDGAVNLLTAYQRDAE